MKSTLKVLALVALALSSWLLLQLTGWSQYLSFEALQANRDLLGEAVESNLLVSLVFFAVANTLATSLSIPGATLFTLAAGFLFGPYVGTAVVNLSASLGAVVVFLLTRTLLGKTLQKKYEPQLARFNASLETQGIWYLLALRLMPVFPFFLINILAGLTKVKPWSFAWTTSVGIIPGSLVYAFAGSQLATIHSPAEILSPWVIGSFVLLALFSLLPLVLKRWMPQ